MSGRLQLTCSRCGFKQTASLASQHLRQCFVTVNTLSASSPQTGGTSYCSTSEARSSNRTTPELPFLYCNTPILKSWDGWSFINNTSLVEQKKRKSWRRARQVQYDERQLLFVLPSSIGSDQTKPPMSSQLSFIFLKLREEVYTKYLSNCF